jgi:hypothetical protein
MPGLLYVDREGDRLRVVVLVRVVAPRLLGRSTARAVAVRLARLEVRAEGTQEGDDRWTGTTNTALYEERNKSEDESAQRRRTTRLQALLHVHVRW